MSQFRRRTTVTPPPPQRRSAPAPAPAQHSQSRRPKNDVMVMAAISSKISIHYHCWKVFTKTLICIIIIVNITRTIMVQQQQQQHLLSFMSLPRVSLPASVSVETWYSKDATFSTSSSSESTTTTFTSSSSSSDAITNTTTTQTTGSSSSRCFIHEPIYITHIIRHPQRRHRHRKKSHIRTHINDTDTTGTGSTTNDPSTNGNQKDDDDEHDGEGAYLIHPNPTQCGTLRRTIWKTGYSILPEETTGTTTSESTINFLAYEIEQRQTNCSLPIRIFHLDNQNGLGAHMHLWSQAYCNNAIDGSITTTTTSQQYRMKTYNPDWLWRDQTYCHQNHHPDPMASPWTCYFPKMEDRCPRDNDIFLHQIINVDHNDTNVRDNILNVTSPYNNRDRCLPLRWPNTKRSKTKHSRTTTGGTEEEGYMDATTRSVSDYISKYRAATTEYIFQSIHPMIVQEAERQIGLLFGRGGNYSQNNPNLYPTVSTTTTTTIPPPLLESVHDNTDTDTSVTVPTDMITVHLRWGDKFFEMDLVSIEEYVQAILDMLQIIQNNNNVPQNHTQQPPMDSTTSANIYLASEDPHAVSEFVQYTQQYYPHWNIYIDRTITEINAFRPNVGNRASWTTKNTNGRAGLIALGSLLVSMESKYYILTTGSNWSRIMNELRLNVIHKRCCPTYEPNCTYMIDLRPGEW